MSWQTAIAVALSLLVGVTNAEAEDSEVRPPPNAPLIFIPGILGSSLVTSDGTLVWGGRDSYANIQRVILSKGSEALTPDSAIENVQIFGPISMGVYDSLFKNLGKLGFTKDKNFFVFAYDWRLSNFDNAQKLKAFVDAKPQLKG